MEHPDDQNQTESQSAGDTRTPFVVEVTHNRDAKGGITPSTRVILSPRLRASGLLRALAPEDLKCLLFVLTYATPNGHFFASTQQLATAMSVSESKARQRMRRLTEPVFEGRPLLTEIVRESGLDTFSPLPELAETVVINPDPSASGTPGAPVARAEDLVALSRENYAHPRSEVERDIHLRNGWPLPEGASPLQSDELRSALEARLIKIGLMPDVVRTLLRNYPLKAIQRQIEWLPYRGANFPDRHLASLQSQATAGMPAELGRTTDPVPLDLPTGAVSRPGRAHNANNPIS